ncbi:MAG: signal peptide peptidase SppA [Planctomycetes bacterium]|nr:signal peptide peptidase SppA [Planctomycetota bacterium]
MTHLLPTVRTRVPSLASLLLVATLGAPAAAHAQAELQATTATKAPPATVAWVRPAGLYLDLPEQGGDLTALLLGGGAEPKPFYDLAERIAELATADGEHVLLDLSGEFQINQVQVAELERALDRVRNAGKHLWAYVENASTIGMQLAASCDDVMIADLGVIELGSPALSVTFLRDALDLLGVRMDVVRCGDFKGAVEPYMLSQMSDHLRAHYRAMLERMNADIVRRIAEGRHLSQARVVEMQSQRLFTARAAQEAGLVDHIVSWQGASHALMHVTGRDDLQFVKTLSERKQRQSINPLAMLTQLFNPKDEEADVEDDTIVVLHLSGQIVDGEKPAPGSIVSGPVVKIVRELTANDSVRGVVLRINSPGGSATASEAILLALRELCAKKPVIVSMGTLAASGGYYITCLGRPILAEQGTITGSIGVFGMRPSFGPLLRRIGVHEEIVGLDAGATMASLSEPWTDQQRARMQAMVDRIYDVFVGHVARSRNLTTTDVLAIAGGRVWSGQQAIEIGLVDRIGGLDDALAMVASQAGLASGAYEVQHLPRPKTLFESLAASMAEMEALATPELRLAARRLDLDRALRIVLDGMDTARQTTVWAVLPDAIRIR